ALPVACETGTADPWRGPIELNSPATYVVSPTRTAPSTLFDCPSTTHAARSGVLFGPAASAAVPTPATSAAAHTPIFLPNPRIGRRYRSRQRPTVPFDAFRGRGGRTASGRAAAPRLRRPATTAAASCRPRASRRTGRG